MLHKYYIKITIRGNTYNRDIKRFGVNTVFQNYQWYIIVLVKYQRKNNLRIRSGKKYIGKSIVLEQLDRLKSICLFQKKKRTEKRSISYHIFLCNTTLDTVKYIIDPIFSLLFSLRIILVC